MSLLVQFVIDDPCLPNAGGAPRAIETRDALAPPSCFMMAVSRKTTMPERAKNLPIPPRG
ncbi:hypothetical protein SLG_27510 [Sphingobium sp. SYK-6]|nr:hypothetical protein SLG_27510 [Sphingobium sp. SYK-6]